MRKIIVEGGKLLEGDVFIQGSKNSALGVIVASLLSKEKVVIQNVPKIRDVFELIEIIKYLNVKIDFIENILIIDSTNIVYKSLVNDSVKRLRASYYFMGLMLSLFKECEIFSPGGCNLGNRPIDMHLDTFEKLGVNIECNNDVYKLKKVNYGTNKIEFKQKSVGATINTLLFASSFNKEIELVNISIEPEVMQVIEALRLMGVDVKVYEDTCIIKGRMKKNGFMISIIPDRIEAGTYALIGAALAKQIRIHNVEINHLLYLLDLFDKINVRYEINKKTLIVYKSNNINGIKINTEAYPGFPTDLQQPLTVLLTCSNSDSVIKETIYKDRTAHIIELNKMGADIVVKEDEYLIKGNRTLVGSELSGKDLRGGASLVFAALLAKGTSKIEGLKYIERGYFNIVDNLKSLGANIDVYEE